MKKMKRSWILCIVAALATLCLVLAACGNTVTFKFDVQGGSQIPEEKLERGTDYTLPVPEREGYSFEGWYLTSDYSGSSVSSQKAEQDCTFYAKWEKLFRVTLDTAGGSLGTTGFYLKAGDSLSVALSDYVPVKDGFQFGAWRRGSADVGTSDRMPQEDITLTARYKVGYRVEIYEQKLDVGTSDALVEYEKAETIEGYEYATETPFTPDVTRTGFELVSNPQEVRSKVLSETDPSSNVFKFYFNRTEVVLYFNANDGESTAEQPFVSGLYGEEIELPTDFTRRGYLLIGWSTTSDGENLYPVDVISGNIYNEDKTAVPARYTLTESTMLYAVWLRGYTDMFGGYDHIYLLGEEVYLERSGVFFRGQQRGDYYVFSADGDEILLTAAVFENHTFCYSDETRANYSATLFDPNKTLAGSGDDYFVNNTTIYFDRYNGIRYAVKDESGATSTSQGTYTIDESGFYHTEFTSGEMVGKDFVFVTGSAAGADGVRKNAFRIRDEEEFALGALPYFAFTGSQITDIGTLQIIFDGFGNAVMNQNGQLVSLSYVLDKETEIFSLIYNGELVLRGKLLTVNGVKGYTEYSAGFDISFTENEGTDTLKLDGTFNAVYTKDGVSVNGYYLHTQERIAGDLLIFVTTNGATLFRIWAQGTESGYVYYYEELNSNYMEFSYSIEGGIQYSPIIVIDGEESFSLYSLNAAGRGYVLIAKGTVKQDETEGKYLAQVSEHQNTETELFAGEGATFDLHKLKAFVYSAAYMTLEDGDSVSVAYWWSYTLEDGEPVGFDKQYTEKNGNGKLTVVSGFGYYEKDGQTYWGSYGTGEFFSILRSNAGAVYFKINDDNTFTLLDAGLLGYAYQVEKDGSASGLVYLFLDGLGNAEFTVVTPAENEGEEDQREITNGKAVRKDEMTEFGSEIFTFTATEGGLTFDFILLSDGSHLFYSRASEEYSGTYTSQAGETLVLDGYTFRARYTTSDAEYTGSYFEAEKDLLCFMCNLEDGTALRFFFDVKGQSFSVRGPEYANYFVIDNQQLCDYLYSLDGNGNLEVIDAETLETLAHGEYTLNSDGTIALHYSLGNRENEYIMGLGIITMNGNPYYALFVLYEETIATYVNAEDWSVLVLDGYGTAILYGKTGLGENGTYVILSEDLLYYVNAAGTSACVYLYDSVKGTISRPELEEKAYFTESLDSLLFTKYGFVIHNNTTICYYNVEDGNVKLYYPRNDGTENKYGYTQEDFGKFDAEKTFEEEKYYINSGFAVSFKRKDDAKTYPIPLSQGKNAPLETITFTPSGAGNYTTNASVLIDSQQYPATVVCETSEEGVTRWLVIFNTQSGYFQYEIEVTYQGEDSSTYSIKSMEHYMGLYSYTYLNAFILFYQLGGPEMAQGLRNDWGNLVHITTYNEAGEESGEYVEGRFGVYSGFLDANGELIGVLERTECELLESEGSVVIYEASFKNESDNFTYHLYFQEVPNQQLQVYAYFVLAFTREQELETNMEGYTVSVERVIATESSSLAVGDPFTTTLYHNGEAVEFNSYYLFRGQLVFMVNGETDEDQKPKTSTHYIITFKEKEGEEESNSTVYESAVLEIKEANIYYSATGSYVEIYEEDDKIAFLCLYDSESDSFAIYPVKETKKNGDNSYTATTYADEVYEVSIDENGTAKILKSE